MKPFILQIAFCAIILKSEIVLTLDFFGSRDLIGLNGFSNLALLSPILLLSSIQGLSTSKPKRKKENIQISLSSSSKPVPNHVVDEIKKEVRKVKLNDSSKTNEQNDITTGRSTSPKDDASMDPMKCFPKALCGVSSEVAQISKRRKNGLVTDYLLLIKAIGRNPDLVQEATSLKIKPNTKKSNKKPTEPLLDDQLQEQHKLKVNDEEQQDSEEEEDDTDSQEDEDEDEDEEEIVKRDESSVKSKKMKSVSSDDDFNKEYLKEKVEMDQLLKETLNEESNNEDNWWGTYGEDDLTQTNDKKKWRGSSSSPPGRPPYFRTDKPDDESSSGGITSHLSRLFGFSQSSPYFYGNGRKYPNIDLVSGIGMDETKEILETAVEIGKGFDKPSQCNEIFNGCKYDYTELLYMIDDMRQHLRQNVKESQSNKKAKTGAPDPSKSNKNKGKTQLNLRSKPSKKKTKNHAGRRPDYPEREIIPNSQEQSQYYGESSPQGFSLSNMFSWLG